jgi:hypothetical protein
MTKKKYFCDFDFFTIFFSIFTLFLKKLFSSSSPPGLFATETAQNNPKIPLLHPARQIDFSKKRVFGGETGQDPNQSKDLEIRIRMPRGTPKTTIQCMNPPTGIPNFGWRAAALPPRAPLPLLCRVSQDGNSVSCPRPCGFCA